MTSTTAPAGYLRPPDARAGRRVARNAVLLMEGVVALAALGGGAAMIADPTGAMGLAPEMLERLPVDSWLLPGLALITTNGILPTCVAVAEVRGRRWARQYGHVLAGTVLVAWPLTETLLFGYPLAGEPIGLRPGIAATGLALIGLGLLLRPPRAHRASRAPEPPVLAKPPEPNHAATRRR